MTEHEHELIIRVAHRTLRATATPAELDEVEVEVDEIEVELGGRHLRPFVVLRRGERRAEAVVLVPRDDDDVAHATKRALAALRGDPAEPGVVSETHRLDALEGVIERGKAAFVEVGEALLEIRDRRLYRESHATFEAYCEQRWEFTKPYAHRMIQAARISEMVPIGTVKPSSESVARELAPVLREAPERVAEIIDCGYIDKAAS